MSVANKFSNDLFDDEDFLKKVAARKKRITNRFFTRFVFFVLIWATLLFYYLTPISRVGNITLIGNYYLTPNEVLTLSELTPNIHLIRVDRKVVQEKLQKSPRLKTAEVSWSPFKLTIELNEIVPIAKNINDEIILTNGELLKEYRQANPTYDLDDKDLHLAKFINSPFLQEARQIAFLENLKIIDKLTFSTIDYLDITLSKDSSAMYFGIYVKISDKTYIRIRATIDVLQKLYETYTLDSIIASYADFTKETDTNIDMSYYDATCHNSGQTGKLQCVRHV